MKKLVVVVAAVALSFAASGIEIVGRMLDQGQRSAVMLQGRLNGCLAAFAEVDDWVELWEVRRCKRNKLYREYEEAVKLAKMILRRYDNSIDRVSAEEHALPAFWIDMSLLYEHYVLGALRKAYGPKILYQGNVATGKPDFLYVDGDRPLILDTKYKPRYRNKRDPMVTQHLGAMLDELDEKGRLRVRAVLAKAAKRTKQPYAGTALYSLAEDACATPAQDKELKGFALALCKLEANHAARIAATFGLEQDIMSCGY